ncbi:MAG: helix-hairpin-helix domain-containing protein [Bacteroidota bacterium]
MKRLRYWVRNYFGFSKTETNGFIILLPLVFVLLASPTLYKMMIPERPMFSDEDRQGLDSLLAAWESNVTVEQVEETTTTILFNFDPNIAKSEDLQRLGIKPYIADRIIKYRSKGGKFKIKSDLQKIYGLDSLTYNRLYTFIDLPAKIVKSTPASPTIKEKPITTNDLIEKTIAKKEIAPFDLNTADTTTLKQIRGIGKVLSGRIIKYRDLLGGFVHSDQLSEVYGLKPDVVNNLLQYGAIDGAFKPRKIKINESGIKTLVRHPYISYEQAKRIVNHRNKKGVYSNADVLSKEGVLDENTLTKIKPYLTF